MSLDELKFEYTIANICVGLCILFFTCEGLFALIFIIAMINKEWDNKRYERRNNVRKNNLPKV